MNQSEIDAFAKDIGYGPDAAPWMWSRICGFLLPDPYSDNPRSIFWVGLCEEFLGRRQVSMQIDCFSEPDYAPAKNMWRVRIADTHELLGATLVCAVVNTCKAVLAKRSAS